MTDALFLFVYQCANVAPDFIESSSDLSHAGLKPTRCVLRPRLIPTSTKMKIIYLIHLEMAKFIVKILSKSFPYFCLLYNSMTN